MFGPAGANLIGKPIEVYFQYLPSAFQPAEPCPDEPAAAGCSSASSTLPNSLTNPATVASVLVAVTVNGITATYAPTSSGNVEADGNWLSANMNLGGAPGQDFSQDGVTVIYKDAPTIGTALQPTNPPLL